MKKVLTILFLFSLIMLAACGSNEEKIDIDKENKQESVNQEPQTEDRVEVNLPAYLFQRQTSEDVIEGVEGEVSITANENGSYSYKMSNSTREEIMKEIKTNLPETIEELKTSRDLNYASLQKITYNDSLTDFTMVVEKERYVNSLDSSASFSLGMAGMMYQLFNGANPNEYSVSVQVKDEASVGVFDEIVFPDKMEQQK
ncbi:hypothetical protein [Halobacillus sp. Cin3]|uniref:hypothetical protein n=1 Tax=Halobacillus sp. Cin3 TaxID=2928441 RepID=UPI00248D53C0|nr:hypothetical protein [Halobacillus sp. Cin3]